MVMIQTSKPVAMGSARAVVFRKSRRERLPLATNRQYAICRVALNYMHQGQALPKLMRVLAPGGKLVLCIIVRLQPARDVALWSRRIPPNSWETSKDLWQGFWLQFVGFQAQRGRSGAVASPTPNCGWLRPNYACTIVQIRWLDCEVGIWDGDHLVGP